MKKLIALISLLFIFVSCDFLADSNDTQELTGYGEFKLTEEAVFMTEEQTSLFASVESGLITIPLTVQESQIPKAGDVILCPITDKTPAGLLVKVISVEKTGTGYVLSTEPAMLQDAFEELKVNSSFDISSFVENITDGDGNIIEAESVSSDIWSDFAGSPEDTTSAIPTKAAGNAELAVKFPVKTDWFSGYLFTEFNLNVDIDISKRQLNRFYVGLYKKTGIYGDVEQILFILRACLHRGNYVFVYEFVRQVFHVQLGRTRLQRLFFQAVQLVRLPNVAADRDNLAIVVVFLQPRNDNGRIQTARICKYYFFDVFFIHNKSPVFVFIFNLCNHYTPEK